MILLMKELFQNTLINIAISTYWLMVLLFCNFSKSLALAKSFGIYILYWGVKCALWYTSSYSTILETILAFQMIV